MKRLASLIAIVFAFAIVPVALADAGGSTTPAPAAKAGAPVAKLRLDILRLRLDLVHLRYRIVCHRADSDKCTQFTQKIVDRLTTLDGNVQQKLADCSTTDSSKKCTVLQKVDDRLQKIIAKLGNPTPSSTSTTSESGLDSGLDRAAGDLAGLAKP